MSCIYDWQIDLIWFVIYCCESVCLLNSGNCQQIKMKKQHLPITLEHMSNGLAALGIEVFVFASVQSLTFYFVFFLYFKCVLLFVFLVLFFIKMEFDRLFAIFFLLLWILLYKMWFKIGRYNIDREKQKIHRKYCEFGALSVMCYFISSLVLSSMAVVFI